MKKYNVLMKSLLLFAMFLMLSSQPTKAEEKITLNPVHGYEVVDLIRGQASNMTWKGAGSTILYDDSPVNMSGLFEEHDYQIELIYKLMKDGNEVYYHYVDQMTGDEFNQLTSVDMKKSYHTYTMSTPEGHDVKNVIVAPNMGSEIFAINMSEGEGTFLLDKKAENPLFMIEGQRGEDVFYYLADPSPGSGEVDFQESVNESVKVSFDTPLSLESVALLNDFGTHGSYITLPNKDSAFYVEPGLERELILNAQTGDYSYSFSKPVMTGNEDEISLHDVEPTHIMMQQSFSLTSIVKYGKWQLDTIRNQNFSSGDRDINLKAVDENQNTIIDEQLYMFRYFDDIEKGNHTFTYTYTDPFDKDRMETLTTKYEIGSRPGGLEAYMMTLKDHSEVLKTGDQLDFTLNAQVHSTYTGKGEVVYESHSGDVTSEILNLDVVKNVYQGTFEVHDAVKKVIEIRTWIEDPLGNKSQIKVKQVNDRTEANKIVSVNKDNLSYLFSVDAQSFKSLNADMATVDADGNVDVRNDGLVTIEARLDNGEKESKLLLLSDSEVKDWTEKTTDDPNKTWTIQFNTEIKEINTDDIQVVHADGTKVEIEAELKADQLKLTPLSKYAGGTYYLYLSKDIKAANGNELSNSVMMSFDVES
ncbi:hypothetical protein H0266_10745 [Halobacillus locisalis]|uniref:SbsA Ig-like domain-containing protein n=1 Tax=Halobacillus locisalis TaxID=220753 RepID=A0A838CTW7_9BACI|nr:hypothetical protein [Halobacillus locisalis]MBA2175371.1 hypothetical protein [Halobacillus locisalis]